MAKSKYVISSLGGFLVGIFLGDLIKMSPFILSGIFLGLVLGLVFLGRQHRGRIGIIFVFGVIIGIGFLQYHQQSLDRIRPNFNREIELTGWVVKHPDYLPTQSRYVLRSQNINLSLSTGRYPEYSYGDILKLKGTIRKPSPYLLHQNVVGEFTDAQVEKVGSGGNFIIKKIYRIKDRSESILNQILNEPIASFAAGLILGSKRNIPDSLLEDFNRTGTTHIIAVSGYNVTILVIYLGILFGIFSRWFKIWGSLLVVIIFVIMTGATASVVRAGILAGLVIIGQSQGRRINLAILILLVATIMVLINPFVLKYDISFQLSFLAFLGLIYLAPVLSNFKLTKKIPGFFRQVFCETLAAQIAVLPILIYYFGRASIISPLVNVLILWAIPAAMFTVLLVALGGFVWFSLGQWIGIVGTYILKYIILIVQTFSKFSFASFSIQGFGWWWMLIYFLALSVLIYRFRPKSEGSLPR